MAPICWKLSFFGSLDRFGSRGWPSARHLVRWVCWQIQSMHFILPPPLKHSLSSTDIFIGIGLGVVFSLLAGWMPAQEMPRRPHLHRFWRDDWSPGFFTGYANQMGLMPFTSRRNRFALSKHGNDWWFKNAGRWICGRGLLDTWGSALLSGHLLVLLAGWMRPVCTGAVSRLACSRFVDGSSRHRLAVAGLVVAVSMVTGMFQMIGSFRDTIEEWFDVRFQADLYVSDAE